ncbi:NUDIX domain-containing protein [Actinoplanes sp. CA-142083]|uniref:NUDIX domain-containing protein n=1 Tax=Actinoplanes sp. CA-142083 TaxID=3239903 RepID=UPI003D8DAF5C
MAEWVRSSIRSSSRAVAVVVRGPAVLVIKRHYRGRDYAVLPGGGVEEGETFEVPGLLSDPGRVVRRKSEKP